MKVFSAVFVLFLLLLSSFSAFADAPIYQGSTKDYGCEVAYNSTDDEYLVIWLESYSSQMKRLLAKRVDKDGQAGTVFTISDYAQGLPSIAYNPEKNEYFVVFVSGIAPDLGIYGQRLSAAGTKIGSATLPMPMASEPTVLFNSKTGNYLVIGEGKVTSFGDYCDFYLYSRKIGSDGQPLDATQTIYKADDRLCDTTIEYSIAYAPVVSSETPSGRYLISIENPGYLTMLDSNGRLMMTLTDTQSGQSYPSIPFQQSKIGSPEGWDLAFGYWDDEPVFLLVWADKDRDMTWQGVQQWTGIWCGIIDAVKIDYLDSDGADKQTFPVSEIYHLDQSFYSGTWNPVVEYNSFANKFMVAWRETPSANPGNDTQVNHIRGSAKGSDDPTASVPDNIILSAVIGNEDPYNPAIATSSKDPNALVVWEDKRDFNTNDFDIWGNILITTAPYLQVFSPNGGENWKVGTSREIVWLSQNFSAPVRIDFSSVQSGFWFQIVASTPNDGSFDWTIQTFGFPVPAEGKIRVADARKNEPDDFDEDSRIYDWSDATFTISAQENTQTGANIQVNLGNGSDITFDNVVTPGNTTMTTTYNGTPPPNGFTITPASDPMNYVITTTATFTGKIKICILYEDAGLTPAQEAALKLKVYENSQWVDITTSLDVNANIICGEVNHLSEFAVMFANNGGPSHFVFTANTGNSYSIVVNAATLDGNPLAIGDEVSVFTPAGLCVGASVWDGTTPLALTAWGDDSQTPETDGYVAGEQMAFRVWGKAADAEYAADPTYSQGNGTFGNGSYAQISTLEAVSSVTQSLALAQGWSWISFQVNPANLVPDSVFSAAENLAIVVNNGGQFYIPNVINSIGQLNILEGYKIYFNSPEQVSVTGQPVKVDTLIPLSTGWNFVSYLPTTSMGTETALNSILNNLAIIKADDGHFFIPNVIDNLNNMSPGEGYKLYLNALDTLTYPAASSMAKSLPRTLSVSNRGTKHFSYRAKTGDSYSVVVNSVQLNDVQPQPGDEIGIFTESGLCVGAGAWSGNGMIGMAAWADDERSDESDGFRDGESMIFKFWDADKRKEMVLSAAFSKGNGKFGAGVFASVELTAQTVPGSYSLNQNYPNPFNSETLITFQLPKNEKVQLKIFNLEGSEIRVLIDNKEMNAGSNQLLWNGLDQKGDAVPSGIYIYRLKTESFVSIKKATLIK